MSKAILVMDMPSSCDMCRLASLVGRGEAMCAIDRMAIIKYEDACKGKPDWCPLKPMPQKQSLNGGLTEFQMGARSGYNLCIDDIMKESESDG